MHLDIPTGDHDLYILENGMQLSVHKHISNTRLGTHLGYNHLHVIGMQIQESSFLMPVFLFGFWCVLGFTNFISGIDLPVGLSFAVWLPDSLFRIFFLDDSSFWGKFSCWIWDLPFGCHSHCWESISIISLIICLLSGTNIPVGFLISWVAVHPGPDLDQALALPKDQGCRGQGPGLTLAPAGFSQYPYPRFAKSSQFERV